MLLKIASIVDDQNEFALTIVLAKQTEDSDKMPHCGALCGGILFVQAHVYGFPVGL